MPSLWRWLWWSLRGRCLRCGGEPRVDGSTRCAQHWYQIPTMYQDPPSTTSAASDTDNGHPWDAFLTARVRAALWLRNDEHRSDEEIAATLSMDTAHVERLLRDR
jgi:hypothetical protein